MVISLTIKIQVTTLCLEAVKLSRGELGDSDMLRLFEIIEIVENTDDEILSQFSEESGVPEFFRFLKGFKEEMWEDLSPHLNFVIRFLGNHIKFYRKACWKKYAQDIKERISQESCA